jgi:DNA primase
MARISEQSLEQVKASADIVDVVSAHVQLAKRSRNFFGLCPFHEEKTPSFSVNPDLQIYKCFGCDAGGDVFKFVQEIDRVSFIEAVQFLAERYGIPLPKEGGERVDELADELYRSNELAAKYFEYKLKQDSGRPALEYLRQRGISDETIDHFRLGFAVPGWTSFMEMAGKRGFKPEMLERAGLVLPSQRSSGHYDRFRNRITFAIRNTSGRVVGFGARGMSPEDQPKYLNSPESPVYHKSSILYGLSESHDAIRRADCAIVVEGYMDVLNLVQAGITEVVASSGTALTAEHCKLLARYAGRVVLLFDGDAAGSKAAMRGLSAVLDAGFDSRVVSLPGGHDPDSFVREEGAEALRALLRKSQPALEFYLDQLAKTLDVNSVSGKGAAVDAVMPLLAQCTQSVRLDLMIRQAAQRLLIDEASLRQDLKKHLEQPSRPGRQVAAAATAEAPLHLADPPPTERDFLGLLLHNPRYIGSSAEQLDASAFSDPRCQALARILFEQFADGTRLDVSHLINTIEDQSIVQLISLCAMVTFDEAHAEQQWGDYIFSFRRDSMTRQINLSRLELRSAMEASQDDEIARINTEMAMLIRERQVLESEHLNAQQ